MKMNDLTKDDINLLIVSYLTNSIDCFDLERLTFWIQSNEDNLRYFNLMKDAWLLTPSRISVSSLNIEQTWNVFKEKLESDKKTGNRSIGKNLRYILIAASWLLFFMIGAWLSNYFRGKKVIAPANPVTITVPMGSRSNMALPDGSDVWINAGTSITYNQDYGKKDRIIHLEGEAYFDVAKDEEHPFIVKTSGINVQALGTKFNVKAYPDEKTISATLEEGKINVSIGDKTGKIKTVLLTSKEKLIFFKATEKSEVYTESEEETILYKGVKSNPVINAKILTDVQTELYTSWKDTRWIIEGQPLGILAPVLERRYNLKFVFYNEELKKYKFSGTIEKETVEQILNAMRLTAPLDYRISKDTVKLLFDKNIKDKYGKIMTRTN